MRHDTLPSSERLSRPLTGTAGTMVAVLLLLAVLPSAAAVTSPMSAAILESTLRDARVIHVQRERPNPATARIERGIAARITWGAEFGANSPAATDRAALDARNEDFGPRLASRSWIGFGAPPTADRALVMVRSGEGCLAPPALA